MYIYKCICAHRLYAYIRQLAENIVLMLIWIWHFPVRRNSAHINISCISCIYLSIYYFKMCVHIFSSVLTRKITTTTCIAININKNHSKLKSVSHWDVFNLLRIWKHFWVLMVHIRTHTIECNRNYPRNRFIHRHSNSIDQSELSYFNCFITGFF